MTIPETLGPLQARGPGRPTTRVVLADDHAVLRDALKALLADAGDIAVVGESADGCDAVQRVMELGPDVALLDIAMPRVDGIEAVRRLREQNCPSRLVMLTMHATAEHVYRAFHAGADGYVCKGSGGAAVIAAVRAAKAGRRYVSAELAEIEREIGRGGRADNPASSLSIREREVLQLVIQGWSSAKIAVSTRLSPKTVDTYRSRLMKKLGVVNVVELVKFAIRNGIALPD